MSASGQAALALHSWTLGARPLSEIARVAARTGYDAVEINWQDIERCSERNLCEKDIAETLEENGTTVAALGVAPGILFATGFEAEPLWVGLRRMSEVAVKLECPLLMTAIGPYGGPVERAVENLAAAGAVAAEHGLRLALEFNFQHKVLHTLDLVLGVVRGCGRENCGMVLDTYHLHRGGHTGGDFGEVRPEEIFLVQVSDVPTRPSQEPGVPLDRLVPGEGVVDWQVFFSRLRSTGYAGPISFEAPNPALWQRSPENVAREGLVAIRRLLSAAEENASA